MMRESQDRAAPTRRGFGKDLWRSLQRPLCCAASLLALSAASGSLWAQPAAWPTKTVRLVVGFAPGGGTDVMARVVAQGLSEALGTTVIVDNVNDSWANIVNTAIQQCKSPPIVSTGADPKESSHLPHNGPHVL